jgi:citrate synthase
LQAYIERSLRMSTADADQYYPGLEGVIANESAIANLEGKGGAGGLEYRGYRIEDLAGAVSYEETAFLLLHGDLPTASQLREFDARLRAARALPEPLIALFREIPKSVHPMDVLRTSVSVLAHFDPEVNAPPTDHAANVRKAERMIAQMATAVAFRERIGEGLPIVPPRDDLDHAANFLNMVNGQAPSETMRKAFDLSLVLYTEHELNASTFAARVTVSTLSDIYSGIVAAIGTLKGPLHGGANEEAWKVLERVGSPENAERWIQEALARKERIMGFGHRVYKTGDPRSRILKEYCRQIADEIGDDRWERIAEPIERAVTSQKQLPPNLDWPSARLYHYMNLDIDLYTPIFAMARVAGWAAHVIEQLDHNRLMRPRARYIGPPNRQVKPIARR